MAKIIIFKNQTSTDFEFSTLGETLLANDQINMSEYTASQLRNDPTITSAIDNGLIVVNDGVLDLDLQIAGEYIRNDTVKDEDGFWYGKRRRFSILWEQTNHGFSVGQVVKLDENTGTAIPALADSHANSATTAFVAEVIDANTFYAGLTGSTISNINQVAVVEPLPLIPGRAYFLSSTAPGKITLDPPTGAGEIVKLVGVAIGDTTLIGFTYTGYKNETAVTGNDLLALQAGAEYVRTSNTWQRTVLSKDVTDPSTLTLSNGDRYIVAPGSVGDWNAQDNYIAEYVASSGTWYFTQPVRGFATMVSDLNDLYVFNGVDWVDATRGITEAIPEICHRTNGTFTQTFLTVFRKIHLHTNIKTDSSTYTYGNDEVTVLKNGWYKIEYEVSSNATSNGRSSMEHRLTKNGTEITGSKSYSYHRNTPAGRDTAHATIWINLSTNDKIAIESKKLNGSTISIANACRLTIEYYSQ